MKMKRTAKRIERESVSWVFGLTGGELEPKPWSRRAYWYEGAPEYTGRDFDGLEIRTAIECRLFGADAAPRGWSEVASYRSSGESECLACDNGDDKCKFCEGGGYIYLGEGWCEVVYRRKQ